METIKKTTIPFWIWFTDGVKFHKIDKMDMSIDDAASQ